MSTVATNPVEPPAAAPDTTPWPVWAWYAAAAFPTVLAAPWLYLVAGQGFPVPFSSLNGLILAALLVTVSVTDLIWWRIPNWATYTAVVWGTAFHVVVAVAPADPVSLPTLQGWVSATPKQWLTAVDPDVGLAGCLLGGLVVSLLWWVFDSGGGDMKLMAAVGTLVGIDRAFSAIAIGFVVAAVAAAVWIVWVSGPAGFVDKSQVQKRTPMAPFFAVGTFLFLLYPG